jgi:hypothetical protein
MSETTSCRTFLCKNCKWPLTFPWDRLLQEAAHKAGPDAAREVVIKCYRCAYLRTYSLDAKSTDRYGEDRELLRDGCDMPSRLLRGPGLKCEEWESCDSRPPFLEAIPAHLSGDLDWRAANAGKGWIAEGLTCANGHPIPIPQPF